MSSPFGSLENPFAKPVQRSKDDAKLVGLILGPEHEAAMREVLGSPPPDDEDPLMIPDFTENEFTDREKLEITYRLTEQHEEQRRRLKSLGLLEMNKETGVEFIRGIDGHEYPYPTVEDIATRLIERKAELEIKAEQGFTKLIIVPFAASLDRQIDGLKKSLLDYKKRHPDFALDENQPVWNWDGYNNADVKGDLVYGVKEFSKDQSKHQGLTKKQILEAQSKTQDLPDRQAGLTPGWRILLLQSDRKTRGIRGIPRSGEGKIDGKAHPRPEIETGKSSNEYLANHRADTRIGPYSESGMTPEDWISAFTYHLQETGKPLDDYQNGEDSLAFLTGAWFKSSGNVPYALWIAGCRQASLFRIEPDYSVANFGSRLSVMV